VSDEKNKTSGLLVAVESNSSFALRIDTFLTAHEVRYTFHLSHIHF